MAKQCFIKKDVVYKELKAKIVSGEYPGEYKLPSEPALAKELGVGRITLRAALEKLEENGLVARFPGKGTFVSKNKTFRDKSKKFLVLSENNFGDIESPATYIIPSIERNCEKRNIATELIPIEFLRTLTEKQAIDALKKANYDGVILNASYFIGNEKELKALNALNVPVLIPHGKPGDHEATGFATLRSDYKESWRDAVKFLIAQGHKHIVTLAAENENKINYLREFEEKEYLDFLAKEGADPDPFLLRFIPFRFPGLTKLLSELIEHSPRPTAIMCFSDFYAMNAYDSLECLSVKLPDEMSVMGYCGFPGAHMLSPPLSTVDFDYSGIGAKAVEILDRADEWFNKKDRPPPNIINQHKLIIRESTSMKNDNNKNKG